MARIGAQVTSKDTYATVKLALNAVDTGYAQKDYKVFLQGSYGNDTNIIKDSDVDVVIRLDSIFTYDISALPALQQELFKGVHGDAVYTHLHFRQDVLAALTSRFGEDVVPGTKAVMIEPRYNRRKTDVLVATQHRKYSRYYSWDDQQYLLGISFHKSNGTRVMNYPTQHRDNMATKNQASIEWFKHIVRIFKNARQKLIEQDVLEPGIAPSYYLEGLLYNVPIDRFGNNYEDSMVKCINWLLEADRSKFLCANEQYPLLDGSADVTWSAKNCDTYLNGLVGLWKGW